MAANRGPRVCGWCTGKLPPKPIIAKGAVLCSEECREALRQDDRKDRQLRGRCMCGDEAVTYIEIHLGTAGIRDDVTPDLLPLCATCAEKERAQLALAYVQ